MDEKGLVSTTQRTVVVRASPSFLRGDCNGDREVNVTDAVCALRWLFGGADPGCHAALDTNGDSAVNIADPVSLLNFLFAGVIVHNLYGKKKDPYQSYEDRARQIGVTIRGLVWTSILATGFIALSIGLAAFDLRHLQPITLSLYFQVLAVITIRTTRIDDVNFEVYREDPLAT